MESVEQYCSRLRESLNVIFTQLCREYERILAITQPKEKGVIEQWISKLRHSDSSVKEMKIRNEIMTFMVECGRNKTFNIEPFSTIPPSDCCLEMLRYLLPPDYKSKCLENSKCPHIQKLKATLKELPNGEKLMKEIPVPKVGTFSLLYLRPTKFT